MIAVLAKLAARAGVPQRAARGIVIGLLILVAIAGIALVAARIRHRGAADGAAKVTATVAREHASRVTEARLDERSAAAASRSIETRTIRLDAKTDLYLEAMIKDLHDAIDAVPPAAAGAALPAAPVDRLRDTLNAGIDRANRAADAAADPG